MGTLDRSHLLRKLIYKHRRCLLASAVFKGVTMKKALKNTICVVLVTIICFLAFNIYLNSSELIFINNSMVQTETIRLSDMFDEDFQNIRTRSTIVEDLMQMNDSFHNSKNFDYFEFSLTNAFATIGTFTGGEKFASRNDQYIYDKTNHELNAIAIGEKADKYFNLSVDKGEFFAPEDYYFQDNGTIQILLGNDYKEIYKVGDTIELTFKLKKYNCSIKGFLAQDSNATHYNFLVNLNDYIVFPSEKFHAVATDEDEYQHQFRMMLDKNNGLMFPLTSVKDSKAEITSICAAVNLPDYGYSQTTGRQQNRLILKLSVFSVILVLCIVVLCVVLKKSYKK